MKPKPFARQLKRVRKICLELPDAMEKISHGEPTFFVKKRVFALAAFDAFVIGGGPAGSAIVSAPPSDRRPSRDERERVARCPIRPPEPPTTERE
jgi:hypothetical protein